MEEFTLKDFHREVRKRKVKMWFSEKANGVIRFVSENKEVIIIATPVVTCVANAAKNGLKAFNKSRQLSKEKDLKELYCYDRSLGHYWKLKRELTNAEWVRIEKRRKDGERLGDILEEMKVLK